MKNLTQLGMCTACLAAIGLASGTAFAQETRSQAPEQRPQAQEQWPQQREPVQPQRQEQLPQEREPQAPGVDDEGPLLDDPDVEAGDEEALVPDGQHADELHWSAGTMPLREELIGSDVVNRDNETIGQVVDLVLDDEEGILEVVVELTEKMGLGSRKVSIPRDELEPVHTEEEDFHLVLDTDVESLKDAAE